MSRHQPLEMQTESLRDNAEGARVDRIWRRLESNLATPVAQKRSLSLAWAPALAAGLVVGFLVGHQYSTPEAEVRGKLVAEPPEMEPAGPAEVPRNTDRSTPEQPKKHEERGQRARARTQRTAPLEEPSDSQVFSDVPVIEPAPPIVGPPPAPPAWLQLAERGEYERAAHGLEDLGGFDAVLYQASADELMILVDVARATGNRGRAIQVLRRVTQSFASDPNAPIAAMTLGRMLMQAGDSKGASEAFSLYRRLSPQGDFAEDALASDIQAAVEEGNWERAQMLARQYESDFPDGRHIDQIREQLATLQQAGGSDPEHEEFATEGSDENPEEELVKPESAYP